MEIDVEEISENPYTNLSWWHQAVLQRRRREIEVGLLTGQYKYLYCRKHFEVMLHKYLGEYSKRHYFKCMGCRTWRQDNEFNRK